ncbi:MAG: VWA domain-containing protein [Tepidiformaceae bacterium]
MSFISPGWLLLLLLIPVAIGGYWAMQRRRSKYTVRFTNLDLLANVVDKTPDWRRHVPPVLFLLALCALIVGVARPETTTSVPKEEATIMLVTDVSGSMNATDVAPTRLAAAQKSAGQLLDQLPKSFRVGLISFSNTVNTQVQPTTDRAAVKQALASLQPKGGTAMGDALMAALDDLQAASATATPKTNGGNAQSTPTPVPQTNSAGKPANPTNVIVLLSDGAQTLGQAQPQEAAAAAAEQGIPIYTIALGTPDGVAQVEDQSGRVRSIPVPPDPQTLQEISDTTGAKSFDAPTAEQLQAVYNDIGSRIGHENKEQEIAYVFAGLGALLLIAGAGLSMLWFNRFP